jgi:hypothetical protein
MLLAQLPRYKLLFLIILCPFLVHPTSNFGG